jgi:putative oxidoreductase
MKVLSLSGLGKFRAYAPLFLRLGVGLIFFMHGFAKFQNIGGVTGFFGSLGIPMANVMVWVVVIVEMVGGICVVLGLLTRLFSLLQVIDMVTAIALATFPKGGLFSSKAGPGSELELLLLLGALTLAFLGAGRLSVDHALGLEPADSAD